MDTPDVAWAAEHTLGTSGGGFGGGGEGSGGPGGGGLGGDVASFGCTFAFFSNCKFAFAAKNHAGTRRSSDVSANASRNAQHAAQYGIIP